MNCKGCMYEGADCLICAVSKLKEEWNNLLKEMPILRKFAKDEVVCQHREDGYEEKARKDLNRHG